MSTSEKPSGLPGKAGIVWKFPEGKKIDMVEEVLAAGEVAKGLVPWDVKAVCAIV